VQKLGWALRAAVVAVGIAIVSASPTVAGRMDGGGGGNDPHGCRAQVRSEMGIAPHTGPAYPSFWPKVRRCLEAAGVRPTVPQSSAAQPVERGANSSVQAPKQTKPQAATSSIKKDERDKVSIPKVTTGEPSRAPARLSALPTPATVGEFGRRVALVIGNSKYQYVPVLPNAANDAEALAKALEETGFQSVTLKTNLTRDQINSALAEFAKIADTADWAAVYYSGHGIESRGANFMIPIDAQLKVDRDIELETVEVTKVLSTIEGARKLRLVILDACRDNPFVGQMKRTVATRSINRGLAPIEADAGMLIVYAAKHGETALDGDGKNSPFATALVNRIHTPNLELRRLFDLVRDDVLATTGRRQQPFSYGSLSGSEDFYFQTK
jgi:Caspase domain